MRAVEQVARAVVVTQRSQRQVQRVSTAGGDTPRELFQCQVYLSMLDTGDPAQRVVLRLSLTADQDQFASLVDDFQAFVASVRPRPMSPPTPSRPGVAPAELALDAPW